MIKKNTEQYSWRKLGVIIGCLAVLVCYNQHTLSEPSNIEFTKISPIDKKSLQRRYDAVIIKGEKLGPLEGMVIASLRLYVFKSGEFLPIPFQIDEADPDGVYILPSGPQAKEDVDKGVLDYNDDLVFMVKDTGDRAPDGPILLPGMDKWVEIELSDPLDLGKKAWVYCCHFSASPPALSPVDYVEYLPEKEQIFTKTYGVGYQNGMSLYTDLFYTDGEDGFGPDLMDRIKMKVEVKFLFSIIKVTKSEEDFREEVVGWKDGPVRVLRNVQNYIRVLFNLSSPSVFSITEYYPEYMYTPLRVTVPFDLKWVFNKFGISEWSLYYYGDLPGLKDGIMYTNKNLDGIPISTTLKKAWYEEHVNKDYLVWGYATKEDVGTWFCNLLMPEPLFQYAKFYLNIDEKGKYKHDDVPGEIGGGAFMNSKYVDKEVWGLAPPGSYQFGLETFFAPPGFTPDGVEEWRQIREFPIQTKVVRSIPEYTRTDETDDIQKIDPDLAKQGTCMKLTDIHGKQTIRYDVQLHFGSILASGRAYLTGQEINTREWYNIKFSDIKFMDLRLEDEEPVTGMKNPLVAKATCKDGRILDIVTCKFCTVSGLRADGKRVAYVFSELQKMEIIDSDK